LLPYSKLVKAKPGQPTLRLADAGAPSHQRSDRRRTDSYLPLRLPHCTGEAGCSAQLAKYRAMRGGCGDVLWALVNKLDFIFNDWGKPDAVRLASRRWRSL